MPGSCSSKVPGPASPGRCRCARLRPQQAALDPIRRRAPTRPVSHAGPRSVVRVDAERHVLAAAQVPAHPLNLVGKHVRSELHRGGQIPGRSLGHSPGSTRPLTDSHTSGRSQLYRRKISESTQSRRSSFKALLRLSVTSRARLGEAQPNLGLVAWNTTVRHRAVALWVNRGAWEADHGLGSVRSMTPDATG